MRRDRDTVISSDRPHVYTTQVCRWWNPAVETIYKSGVYSISSANSDTKVWRIGKAGRPQENIVGTLNGNTLNVTLPEASERYVVVNTSATFPTPTFVEHVKNQDLHADESYDMVVIVPKSGKLMSQAQRLIDAHVTDDSLRIRLVRADELYNEFS